MLPVHHILTRTPLQNGQFQEMLDRTIAFIDPGRVDTLTVISDERRKTQAIPSLAMTIIRYVDVQCGYRLIYVEDLAQELSRSLFRLRHGEDPQSPDYGSIPNGI